MDRLMIDIRRFENGFGHHVRDESKAGIPTDDDVALVKGLLCRSLRPPHGGSSQRRDLRTSDDVVSGLVS